MAAPFKPSQRQLRLIAEAEAALARALEHGHFAPDELVRRMTIEGQMVAPESTDSQDPAPNDADPRRSPDASDAKED